MSRVEGHHENSGASEGWRVGFTHPKKDFSITPLFQYSITPFFLSMTNRAARETFDPVLLDEFLPECNLIRRRLPVHAEDLFTRAHKALRAAMAFQTPL